MEPGINWLAFRAEVAKEMLPIVYRELSANHRLVTDRDHEAAAAAVNIAYLLEDELKRCGG